MVKGLPNRRCKICKHNDRERMEWMAASGASLKSIASKFQVPYDPLWRHWQNHVSDHRRATLLAGPLKISQLVDVGAEESKSVIDHLKVMRGVVYDALLAASEAGDRNGISMLTGRALEILQELGRASGELIRAGSSVSLQQNNYFFGSPVFRRLETGLLEVCRRHPEVRDEVVNMLRNLDGGASSLAALPAAATGAGQVIDA